MDFHFKNHEFSKHEIKFFYDYDYNYDPCFLTFEALKLVFTNVLIEELKF